MSFDRNSYETPQWLFDEYDKLCEFTWDLACTVDNAKCPQGIVESSLETSWHRLTPHRWLWLNPPYNPLKPWIIKAQQEARAGAKIVALVPLPTITTAYFDPSLVCRIEVIKGRISFERNGVPHHGNDSTHCLLFYDIERVQPLRGPILNFLDAKKTELEWILK